MNRKKIFMVLGIIWMAVIFYMSHQPASVSSVQSDRVIDLLGTIPVIDNGIDRLVDLNLAQFIIRKGAHIASYCLLAILWFMAIYDDKGNIIKTTIIAFAITFIYACTDEMHQLFIPGRSGEIRDVLVDSSGAIIGLLLINITYKLKKIKLIR